MGRQSVIADPPYTFTSRGNWESSLRLPACFWKLERYGYQRGEMKPDTDTGRKHEGLHMVAVLRVGTSIWWEKWENFCLLDGYGLSLCLVGCSLQTLPAAWKLQKLSSLYNTPTSPSGKVKVTAAESWPALTSLYKSPCCHMMVNCMNMKVQYTSDFGHWVYDIWTYGYQWIFTCLFLQPYNDT